MKICIYTLILAVLIALPVSAIDMAAMQTALKVQERILDTIIESDTAFTVDVNSDGIYLAGFGAVITIKISEEWKPSFLVDSETYPELQMQLSMSEAEVALKDATEKLEDAIEERETFEQSRQRSEIEQQIEYVQQERDEILQTLEESVAPVEAMELRRRDHELQQVDVELQEELNRLKESVQVFEAAIEASQKAIGAYAPRPAAASSRAEATSEFIINIGQATKDKKARAVASAEDIDRMLVKLQTYMADYGPALNLDMNEILLLRTEFTPIRGYGKSDICYEISTSGKELSKLRSGKLNRDKFLGRIAMEECNGAKSTPADIVIMKNILNTAFEDEIDSDYNFHFINRDEFWESYIPGFGAIFFRKYNPGFNIIKLDVASDRDEFIVVSEGAKGSGKIASEGEKISKTRKSLAQLEEELIDLLINYSQTLRSLRDGEQVVVAVKMQEDLIGEKESTIVIKLKTSDISRYSPAELRKRIEIVKI